MRKYRHSLKPQQIADRLGIRLGRFYVWAREHDIPEGAVRKGPMRGALRYSWPEVQEWLKGRPDLVAKLAAERSKKGQA